VGLIAALVGPDARDNPARQIETILERGYGEYLQLTYENAEARHDDLVQLARYAARYESTEQFLSELALVDTETFGTPRGVTGEDVVEGSVEDELLVLSTIHQAKGLEWRAVFLVWASDGKLPSARSLRDPDSEEEERRLFYVAVTRAKDELAVCYPLLVEERAREAVIQRPSRFVTEVSPALFEIWDVDEERAELSEPDAPKLIN
jgi:DNA helicase-2/ATP-dependent DNA helicase PcrA